MCRVSSAPCSCPCFGSFWQRASYQQPTHFSTHMILLFLDVTCTANIDDCIQLAAELWPVTGAGYQSMHRLPNPHYGHHTTWMDCQDWTFPTLCDPLSVGILKKLQYF
ncbi:Delta(7)-sterol-C5(6)-desaturase 1 [Vitis vinifera]|uniref:Delta(7)-sterol-C5(6)-desaturase 1 n=1 Tax=Vitis vinifera TaxID=29760 RepID=A0A438JUR6_VITVI|nr:Delta(7)-sterol-C5(6)-desaturase 1 [Vitis vinifera]